MDVIIYDHEEYSTIKLKNPKFIPRKGEYIECECFNNNATCKVKKIKYDYSNNVVKIYT